MLTVDVQFMIYLESLPDLTLGKKIVPIKIKDGSTFGELLQKIADKYGTSLGEYPIFCVNGSFP